MWYTENLPVAQPQHQQDDNDDDRTDHNSSSGEDIETEIVSDDFIFDTTAVL